MGYLEHRKEVFSELFDYSLFGEIKSFVGEISLFLRVICNLSLYSFSISENSIPPCPVDVGYLSNHVIIGCLSLCRYFVLFGLLSAFVLIWSLEAHQFGFGFRRAQQVVSEPNK